MFETLSSEVVHDGYVRVTVDRVRMPDGSTETREYATNFDAVAVVALTDGDEVVLLRQYRQPHGTYFLELPAGKLDVEGEDPADAAQRELVEEAGMRAGTLVHLTRFANSAGWTTERTDLYLATGLERVSPPADFVPKAEEADMEVLTLPLDAALDAVRDGTVTDAKTILGILLAADRRA
ncbi:MAG: NUDIX domain-containing protein [Actinomycetes bacterium]